VLMIGTLVTILPAPVPVAAKAYAPGAREATEA